MFVRRFYDDRLAQASYLIACQRTGEAIVIDPPRDVEEIIAVAAKESFKITRVSETHIHADFLSGSREMVAATGANAMLSAEGGSDWQYSWPANENVELLHHGDVIVLGGVELTVRHTPGHTPEHICFVVTDTARSTIPVAMVSGDFLFVGDVGRPDLLERAAHIEGTMEGSARQLYHSLAALSDLPDHLQIWPGHGAGSACGKALGAVPSSTLGYERLTNWAFAIHDEEQFVKAVLEGQPAPPTYFATMKRMNKAGPPVLGSRTPLPRLDPAALTPTLQQSVVIDVRSREANARQHIHGTISIPLIKAFPTWAGWFVPYDRPIALIVANAEDAAEARRALSSIGLDDVIGYFDSSVIAAAVASGLSATTHLGDINASKRYQEEGRVVIDLRAQNEWDAGHIPGARHHFLGGIEAYAADLKRDTPIAVHCEGGTRSAIGASVLERMGFTDVIDLTAGYGAWIGNP